MDPPPGLSPLPPGQRVPLLPNNNWQFFLSLSPSSVFLKPPHLAFAPHLSPGFLELFIPWLSHSLIYSFDKHFKDAYFGVTETNMAWPGLRNSQI